jgi:hypothetical protein
MKQLVQKFALLICALLVSLLGLELALRLAPPRGHRPDADRSSLFYDLAPERDHPASHGTTQVLRIAVVGDSFSRGIGVQIDDRYGARIERMLNLNKESMPAEVLVYSRPGTSTFQQLDLLPVALAQKPAIVILGICLNDTENWADPNLIKKLRADRRISDPPAYQAWLAHHSRAAGYVLARMRTIQSSQHYVAYYRYLYQPDGKGVRRFRKAIERFRDECAAHGAVFVPVIFPLLSFDFSPDRYPFQFAHEYIHRTCDDLGVRYLDLLPAFQGTSPARMQAIPDVDPHPSEIAHRIAAESIVTYLLDARLIGDEYRPVERNPAPTRAIWQKTMDGFRYGY